MVAKKLGRNDPCHCGSGKKFKKCCANKKSGRAFTTDPFIPPEILRRIEEQKKQDEEHRARFGEIRPIISINFEGQRIVAIGNVLRWAKDWKFFPDFLQDYVPALFGQDWGKAEMAKPEPERHPVWQLRAGAIRFMNSQRPLADGTFEAEPNGFLAGYMAFAYDLYIVQDNSRLDEELLRRLKHIDQFQGARHELFTEATCLRAGFTIEREDEKDNTKRHAEFTAKHKATGQMISVEAKSKHRSGILGRPGTPQSHDKLSVRFGDLLNAAIAKNPPHPLVINIDTNLPERAAERLYAPQCINPFVPSGIITALLYRVRREYGGAEPYAMLTFSNHPHHYASPHEADPKRHLLSVMPISPSKPVIHQQALLQLHKAAWLYGNVPNEFPENP